MTPVKQPKPDDPAELAAELGVQMDAELFARALTHRSYAYENGDLPHNERLEFLGDSVLGVVITESLYRNHPELPEGKLAKLRASVVNMRALADVARNIGPDGIGRYLLLGRGEDATGGRDKPSILADTLEAILGAIHLQHGIEVAADVIHQLFDDVLRAAPGYGAALDWKTSLQELTALRGLGVPEYEITSAGPDHAKSFTAAAVVDGVTYGMRPGRSKKEAEQSAAEAAWRALTSPDGDQHPVGTGSHDLDRMVERSADQSSSD
jgi:ribonuclease III